ncbi:putative GTP-binding protein [Clavispora lusitaniae]|uniref:GTP-binding protein n=1 Tax=Clavispora lusitaniae TaxID=36911 RepID=A0ACD0WMH3_CLALS|nr:putative GTP-binding protein [Clavispora lusitaniae]QFZ34168.1 putative GTP-binding protein [Clavispora lusitaniae]QFZ39852.1 putative GTP-binding protein [Clavispora lusitaniae]QFZ45534.1 putative GTP-binding protein [Clavispora lusitaniae]QFZ51198.1 putative GTP-binding protein [Clavispora lusitaniae]
MQVLIRRKLVIVGDGACGKTSLLYVFTLGEFPTQYHPTVFENYVTDCRIDGKPIQLALWDTAGQEEYERLRPLSYHNSHVILIGFALDVPDTLENARTKWVEEVKECCPEAPYILIGLKKDLRISVKDRVRFVQVDQGERVAREIGARRYMESSALTGEGVDDIFEVATRLSLLLSEKPQSACCTIL